MTKTQLVKRRVLMLGNYIKEHNTTIRETSEKLSIPKSIVHKDVSERLQYIDNNLYMQVQSILKKHKADSYHKGGEATKMKYSKVAYN
jgi:putative DeoR family transcriptional regulator (stage III sporulation protein D)